MYSSFSHSIHGNDFVFLFAEDIVLGPDLRECLDGFVEMLSLMVG